MSQRIVNNVETSKVNDNQLESYSKQTTKDLRKKHIGPSIQVFFSEDPLKIVRGQGQYLYDENNTEYLDCINNVAHIGHSHQSVVDACVKQLSLLNTNIRFLHDNVVRLAKRLSETMPSDLEVCYFVNSGSEANDLALQLARYYTRSKEALVLDNAYHGHLIATLGVSPYKFNHSNCEELQPDWAHVIPSPDRYRGKYRDSEYSMEELTDLYVDEVKRVCESLVQQGKSVGVFILETMQSCAGQVVFPAGYLRRVINLIHEYGGLVIADEVQVGFGRTGEKFWAFQLDGDDIVPDIITMAKSMGNGHPIGAVVTSKKVADAFRRGPDYFNTCGGSPVSCAIALAVLDVLEEEHLQENALRVGDYLKSQFESLIDRFELVGDVRGLGFFLGLDLVKDRKSREPATEEAKSALYKLRQHGILMSRDGPYENILKFKPPMCFTQANAEHLVANLIQVLEEVQDEIKSN